MNYQDILVSNDPTVVQTLLEEIVSRQEDFTEGYLFNFLFYKKKREVIQGVREFPEVQPYILIEPLSPSLSIPQLITRLKQLLDFEINSIKPKIMESFAHSIKNNPTKHELLYEQLTERSKSETNPYLRKKLLDMIAYIKHPDKVSNPFNNLSL